MGKFKKGDKVTLNSTLRYGDFVNGFQFIYAMDFNDIKEVVDVDGDMIELYGLRLFTYTDGMLDLVDDLSWIQSDCPEPTFFKKPHYSSLSCRHKFSPIKFSR